MVVAPYEPDLSLTDSNSEVEYLIESGVESAVASSPSLEPKKDLLVDRLVQALEGEASWVQHYEATGELNIPRVDPADDDLDESLLQITEVNSMMCNVNFVLMMSCVVGFTAQSRSTNELRRVAGDCHSS